MLATAVGVLRFSFSTVVVDDGALEGKSDCDGAELLSVGISLLGTDEGKLDCCDGASVGSL